MKVIDSYSHEGQIHFVLDTGEIKSFSRYWSFGALLNSEYQELLRQVTMKCVPCWGCGCELMIQFPEKEGNYCAPCQIQQSVDQEILDELLRLDNK